MSKTTHTHYVIYTTPKQGRSLVMLHNFTNVSMRSDLPGPQRMSLVYFPLSNCVDTITCLFARQPKLSSITTIEKIYLCMLVCVCQA